MNQLVSADGVRAAVASGQAEGRFWLGSIPTHFSPDALLKEYHAIVEEYALKHSPRADGSTLRSISLTHRPGAPEPLYDGNNTQYDPETNKKFFLEEDFTEFNTAFTGTLFHELYLSMPFSIGRMRLNLLPPLTVFSMHRDSAPRAHFVLDTNPACFLISGDGQAHHVLADGNVHVYDTTLPHTAFNASRQNRMHLTMSLAGEER